MSSFSFSFAGDDIEDTSSSDPISQPRRSSSHAAETGSLRQRPVPAFPVTGQASLPPTSHSLSSLLDSLPSKIVYTTLTVKLDDGSALKIPRRELWDVRVQLMAEDDDEGLGNLGKDDVRTGVYEGGFKSWESAVDLVRVLQSRSEGGSVTGRRKFLELGCGTALPSLAIFQWLLERESRTGLDLGLADYNPTVLQLVTLPNLILSWAQVTSPSTWEEEGELDITPEIIQAFLAALTDHNISLYFFSGSWSPAFIELVSAEMNTSTSQLTIIGAETIYSPVALQAFAVTLLGLIATMKDVQKSGLVAAKLVYFGVGGSMEDFCEIMRNDGKSVEKIREESDGVRRATVEIKDLTS